MPGPGEVLIAVKAACLHLADVAALAGERAAHARRCPSRPASRLRACDGCGRGCSGLRQVSLCWPSCQRAGLAEEAVARAALCVALPEALSFELAAALPVAYAGALMALRDRARLVAGETLLVLGAGGQAGLGGGRDRQGTRARA